MQPESFTLWMGRMKVSKSILWLWTQSGNPLKPANALPAYLIEHPIYMTEMHECTQKLCTIINAEDVVLIRKADYEDYEKHLIIDVPQARIEATEFTYYKQFL